MVCGAPLRMIPIFTSRPAGVSRTMRENWSIPSTRWPLYCVTTSPVLMPAFSAGLSGAMRVTSTPASSGSFSALARSLIDLLNRHAQKAHGSLTARGAAEQAAALAHAHSRRHARDENNSGPHILYFLRR